MVVRLRVATVAEVFLKWWTIGKRVGPREVGKYDITPRDDTTREGRADELEIRLLKHGVMAVDTGIVIDVPPASIGIAVGEYI
jgi:hypothetical protein